MGVKVTNNGFGTLSAGINSSATTVTVDSGQGARFPTLASGDFFFATLVDTSNNLEIIKVTARSTDSMTVIRGQDNTTALSFSIGDRIELRPTAALFENAHLDNTPTSTGSDGLPKGTTAQRPTASATEGHIRYNTDENAVYYSDGTNWLKISSTPVVLSSVSGNIYDGAASNLTLAGTGFLAANLIVNFVQSSDSINVNVTVTPTSDTAATVAVPYAVYNAVTAGNAVTIKVTNSDGAVSGTVNKTAVAAPTGGTKTTSGNYCIHTFTTSANFVVSSTLSDVEYLIIAGGGSGATYGAGGGAGGYRSSVTGQASGGGASAESKMTLNAGTYGVVVGAGASGAAQGAGLSTNGNNSVFNSITSIGGGGGGLHNPNSGGSGSNAGSNNNNDRIGRAGGSSGGSGRNAQAPTGATANQGTNGGAGASDTGSAGDNSAGGNPKGGGGGGAGTAGANGNTGSGASGGNGGNGVSSNITGSAVTRGGGGGGASVNGSGGSGGSGGGGNGGSSNTTNNNDTGHQNGDPFTGGGGGGRGSLGNGTNGGSGIVIIRYEL